MAVPIVTSKIAAYDKLYITFSTTMSTVGTWAMDGYALSNGTLTGGTYVAQFDITPAVESDAVLTAVLTPLTSALSTTASPLELWATDTSPDGDVVNTGATGDGTDDAEGYYASQTDMETRFGAENVAAYSNVNGNTTEAQTTRLRHVLDDADRQIDEIIRANGYSTPVATTSTDFDTLTDIACDLAYVKLQDVRMVRHDPANDTGREMFFKERKAMRRLMFIIRRGIDATRLADTINDTNGRQPHAV